MTHRSTRKRHPGAFRFVIMLFQIILYIPVQILFIPIAVIGIIIGIYKEFGGSKKLGVSFSAGQVLQSRWFMHYFDTRPDPLTVAFTKKFPCESHLCLWSIMGALIISQRLFGFATRLATVAEPEEADLAATSGSRMITFDRIMEKYVDEVEQIVLPGAGFDLITLLYTKGRKMKVFELDQVKTLQVKVETLKKAGIEHDWIHFIPVDYNKESWIDKLLEAGFDPTKKTLFLWQSVSLYLEADVVKETLRGMADLCADGSVIVQDLYSESYIRGEYSFLAKRNMRLIEKMGEPVKFGIDMSNKPKAEVDSFLQECGLRMTNYIQFGEKLGIEPFYCIVEAEKLPIA
jgi:methyltransferase (TIGR00027 family)